MVLNHINLAVTDVRAARGFLMAYFKLDPQGLPGNDRIAFLRDEQGMILTLTNIDGAAEVRYPGAFHIGFGQESPAKVDEINRRLKADGYDVPEPSKQHGSWTFYFEAPGGIVIEVLS
ncbi:VOC family protein [Tautonia plasticadhaerens]|uniref:Glyoxalase-like domain protein n=1 Tax=Tautonia plasticadhaerens TaxID=2527974 RepID=A0A518GXL5_9BACT|nr:VOC family protein [Tautonia plasticadhaerens]QDV33338.1 Glyoxalase-like domain protein [Tautonia plasticadhaerens]